MLAAREKLKRYFSGRLAIVQISAGVGAFAGRSIAALLTQDQETWAVVLSSQLGSFAGYISTWILGYWLSFKADYRASGRAMSWDIVRLELVEQTPSLAMAVPSALAQAALIESNLIGSDGLNQVVSVNLGSWFGPHRVVNFTAMLVTNSMKKAWVDGTWRPFSGINRLAKRLIKRDRD